MLSVTTQHALRALVALARQPEGSAVLGRDLSEMTGVPANYLSKILLDLKRIDAVAAVRGTGGGYRLGRPPEAIRLVDVVRLFEPGRATSTCLLGGGALCSESSPCTAHHRWREVRDTYLSFLEETSLAEIARA